LESASPHCLVSTMMRVAVAALLATVTGAASAGKAIDAFCNVMSAIPKGKFTGRKEDMAAVMKKFSGMMADKVDCSVDPSNRVLGFDLKGVSFEECSAASVKQQQAQTDMIGLATGGTASCIEKIVDEEANTAAAWMQMDSWVAGYHMRSRIATRFNMDGDKIAGYHMIFDTYQIFALQKLLAKDMVTQQEVFTSEGVTTLRMYTAERTTKRTRLASSASAGKAVDAFCNMVSSIPKGKFTGRKEDMEAVMQKFAGMMANKLDCSVDPNNKILGFDLKGVSFAECSAASVKQQQMQTEMIGFSSGGTASCIEKIVDEEANTAAAWMQMDFVVAGHHLSMRSATRFNMDGDKIAGYHTLMDTYQVFALQEILSRERAKIALYTSPVPTAGKAVDAFCDVMSAIPKEKFTGRKEDMVVVMKRFSGMMANKVDCSVDPNNKLLGFDLKGVSFAECSAASVKQQQAQDEMIGFSTRGSFVCTEKIVDEEANTAAVWMQMDSWVSGHHLRSRVATRFNMDGDKIAGYHMIFDTYQIFALQELLAREREEEGEKAEEKVLPIMTLGGAPTCSAGRAVDAMCETFDALGRPQASGGKDMQVTMYKFEALFAAKFDVSEDPNNAMLGINLQGASFAEFEAAKMKQMQTQAHMLGGMQTKWTMTCFHKIVDADTNNAAVWLNMNQEDSEGKHLFTTRWAMRLNMEGDKIAGIHSVYDTFQLVALSEQLARGRAVTLSTNVSSWAGVGAMALLGVVVSVIAFIRKKEQKSYTLMADETSA